MPPTAVAFGLTLWQLEYSPRAQNQHDPQKMLNGTITRSPTRRFCTDGPTCSTTPMNSWPKVMPTRVSGIIPWYRCRSDPQIAASVTRTIASFGCSMAGISFSSTRTLYGPRYTIARMNAPFADSRSVRSALTTTRTRPTSGLWLDPTRPCKLPSPRAAGAPLPRHVEPCRGRVDPPALPSPAGERVYDSFLAIVGERV